MNKSTAVLAALIALACATVGTTAKAAFQGANGKLAFVKGDDIWVADTDGSNASPVTTAPGFDRSPRWSPDGTEIAFASNRDGDFEILVMNADGSNVRQITFNTGEQDRIPSWTSDGTQIVYDKNFVAIYAINADGSGGERKLADGRVPGTSPRSDKVVFGVANSGLLTMNLDGSGLRQVTSGPADFSANWSPRGNDLVFTSGVGDDRDVYAVHTSGGGLVNLTQTSDRFEFAPVWSPDGTRIAFVGCPGPSSAPGCNLYLADRDGANEVQAVTEVVGGEGAVDWQPLVRSREGGGAHERLGARLSVLGGATQSFPAGQPFHVVHGWGISPDSSDYDAVGTYDFSLTVDGIEVPADLVERSSVDDPVVGRLLSRLWVRNFPAGMTGTHTFRGRWIGPCQALVDAAFVIEPCKKPTETVVATDVTTTVTFSP